MIVCKDGTGDFTTIQEAVNSIPDDNRERVTIHIKQGIYYEKLNITKNNISLIGENEDNTKITYDDSANKLLPNGEKMRTFNSYSVFIDGEDFIAENITFENSAGDGSKVGQAVAVYLDGDRAILKKCKLLGHQDTLFTGPLPPKPIKGNSFGGPKDGKERRKVRQYFENCFIRGDVDFIFGSATAVFNQCEIFSNNRNKQVNGYITAASTPKENKYGYVFINCKFMSDAKPHSVYLGRPWRDYAKTAFINCFMDEHIILEGFHDWNKTHAQELVEYVEYNNYGTGVVTDKRVKWARQLSEEEAKEYTIIKVLSGKDNWNPQNE